MANRNTSASFGGNRTVAGDSGVGGSMTYSGAVADQGLTSVQKQVMCELAYLELTSSFRCSPNV